NKENTVSTMTKKLNENGLPEDYPFKEHWEIAPRQVKQMLDSGEDFLLIDCRKPDEWDTCHIEGAKLIPIQQVAHHYDQLEKDRDKKIVIHCHSGGRSMKMTQMLRHSGFKDVKSMAGGIDLWAVDIDPSLKRY